jgi:L-malate glycosyltransferase
LRTVHRTESGNTTTIHVAIVAPSLRILGGQAIQADRLLTEWRDDPDVHAWLVPVNPMPPPFLRRGVRVKYLRTIVTQLAYWPRLMRELRRADLVHVFSASYFSFLLAPLPAIVTARLLRKPVVLNYRSGEAPDHLSRSTLARRVIAGVDRNAVPSRFLQDVFARFGIEARVIPNIVDVQRFAFRRRERLRPTLLSTRNFEPLYNVACTLRAFRLIQDVHAEATLTLVGGGAEEPRLRAIAERLGLRGVTFAGRVRPADIWKYYAESDLYVQTPNIDNMPASIIEAYASGTPVVSTAAGGVPAILTHETHGLLAPLDDHETVARHVLRLLSDPALGVRLAEQARAACDAYTWPRVRDQWLALYRELAPAAIVQAAAAVNPA